MEGADKAINEIYVEVFGERRQLVPNFETIARFEKAMGSFLDAKHWNPPSITALTTLLWAALGGEKSGKTLEEVSQEISSETSEKLGQLIASIFLMFSGRGKKNADAA